ncbi:MAG: exopolysaccharide biosynthesis protein [Verrucomicrobia bacterium]|nr:exopolysaccharide biosynthesis protein [Verrucomicrobiota bacterium]
MTQVILHDPSRKLSATLLNVVDALPSRSVTLRDLLTLIGEEGLLLLCAFLTLPFLIPVSIPGVSTVFGLAIILIGMGVTFNRLPWFPPFILNRPLSSDRLKDVLRRGAALVARFERFVRPRWPALSGTAGMNYFNGVALVFGGVLLMLPLGLVPFSNTLPALAILFLAMGMLERDGLCILGGYFMNVATVIYFTALAIGVLRAGEGLSALFGS